MDARTFFTVGEEVEIRRVDERGDSAFALVAAVRGGKVALSWRGGCKPESAPQPGGIVRLIRQDDLGHQFAVKAHVAGVQPEHTIVIPRSKPVAYDRREYLRVEAPLPIRYRVVDQAEARSLRAEIEGRASAGAARTRTMRGRTSTLPGLRVPGGARALSPVPETSPPALPHEAQRQLDRIEEKLDRILDHLGLAAVDGASAPRRVIDVDISGSGLRFRTRQRYDEGTLLEIDLELPLSPPARMRALISVVRCSRPDGPSPDGDWMLAGQYDAIHEDDRGAIVRYTFDRQREEKRSESAERRARSG